MAHIELSGDALKNCSKKPLLRCSRGYPRRSTNGKSLPRDDFRNPWGSEVEIIFRKSFARDLKKI